MPTVTPIRSFPWGGHLFMEIPLHKKSANKFYARHGETAEGRQYIEFSKFGPRPNTEHDIYNQKLRLFSPLQWIQLKHYVERELTDSIGWDLTEAERIFEKKTNETTKSKAVEAPKA
ncbi:hypothetical protein KDA23_05920 [Candidatus Saccharibacteria bacterium]|nr:hypothetical protein [Candidatus Saccharibacteria bacterium]